MILFSSCIRHATLPFATLAAAVFSVCNPVLARAQDAGYHVIEKQHLDGEVRWDYLTMDAEHRHLFITHGDKVDVYDVDKKQIVGAIANTPGVHGVALAPELDRGFTSNGTDNSVSIFSLSTLNVIGNTPSEKKPDAIVYDPVSKRVFAANGGSESLTPIDAVAGKSLPAIKLGGKPESAAVDGKGHLFINIEDKNQLVVVDTMNLAVTNRYDLSSSCDEPAGISIDSAGARLFIGCHNQKMAIVDANTGKVLDTPKIGRGSDATTYDATKKRAFSSNSDGTLNVIAATDGTHYRLEQTVTTMPGARTMALDPASHKLYLVTAEVEPAEAPAEGKPAPRRRMKAGTFTLIVVSP